VGAAARRWLGMTGKSSIRPPDPCCFVVFGASGDLTHRLLIPALYNLAVGGLLPEPFSLAGVARDDVPSEAFRTTSARRFMPAARTSWRSAA
jgi:glucose-6-phosphate 1-dehydrogenase